MNYSMTFISPLVAEKFNQELPGCPTENRVLILSPKEVNQTKSGLIIPEHRLAFRQRHHSGGGGTGRL